jgi:hypothetical protein
VNVLLNVINVVVLFWQETKMKQSEIGTGDAKMDKILTPCYFCEAGGSYSTYRTEVRMGEKFGKYQTLYVKVKNFLLHTTQTEKELLEKKTDAYIINYCPICGRNLSGGQK